MSITTRSVEEGRALLREAFARAARVVALTGAGISTECGVPDFRSPDSPWRRYPPIDFAAFTASAETRVEAWRRKFAVDDIYAGAEPGRTHRALATLAQVGRLEMVVTQNIDGLHQGAGLPPDRLIELHGNGTFARCLSCGLCYALADVRRDLDATGAAPACPCGGMIKSATIAFGQPVPMALLTQASAAALDCDLFLVLGSSLVVRPAAALPLIAAQAGARLVIVNRDPTPLDAEADCVIHADVGSVLEPWCAAGEPAARRHAY